MNDVEGLRKQNPKNWEIAVLDSPQQYDGGLYVGGLGNLIISGQDGNEVTFSNFQGFFPTGSKTITINSSSTATSIVGLKK